MYFHSKCYEDTRTIMDDNDDREMDNDSQDDIIAKERSGNGMMKGG